MVPSFASYLLFEYKQTGAGKTYTMAGFGGSSSAELQLQGGVQPRALRALLAACRPNSSKKKKDQDGGAVTSIEEAEGTTRRMKVRRWSTIVNFRIHARVL